MRRIQLVENGKAIPFLIENCGFEGVKKIASKVAGDVELVTGVRPVVGDVSMLAYEKVSSAVLVSTEGKSPLLKHLEASGRISLENIRGKREVYGIFIVEEPGLGLEQMLVICGSDKRGTIYGLFHLSEHMGVSPLIFWGDAKPARKEQILFTQADELVSREPSVRYRGFFINDEWPCFGNWAMQHFDGFHAQMYDHVFELLLRLKGNYLWPAMWTSSFALDGPGEENEELADCYGVIMGYSHHEPCLRASEEWDIYKGKDTSYGTQWNYVANKPGLLQYWEDGLKRSGKYENIVTIGMRGERDSQMQGANTLQEHVDVLKDIITHQEQLISKYADTKDYRHPRLLAIYKEVERFFYGDAKTAGLKDWDGIKDTILLFCDDNYGNMRWLPDESMRAHAGGFGMYFHLDYHGAPISYEWINSTPLSKIWEQMTTAYEYGVRDLWIVNVGDLKGNEYPLSYFMNLAYDYEIYGSKAPNQTREYTKQWLLQQFGKESDPQTIDEMEYLLREMGNLFHLRRPEALSSHTYHACHYQEADRMISRVKVLQERADWLYKGLDPREKDAFYSMIYYPLCAGCNLLLMQLYAGKNEHYAKQGKPVANIYYQKVKQCIQKDREIAEAFASAFAEKWRGMELATHVGFCKWNEDGCRYPVLMEIEPFQKPRMAVSRSDGEAIAVKNYGSPEQIVVDDFCDGNTTEVVIEIANMGTGSFDCYIQMPDCDWLKANWKKKSVSYQEELTLSIDMEKLPKQKEKQTVLIANYDTTVAVVCYAKSHELNQGDIQVIDGANYVAIKNTEAGYFQEIQDFGVTGVGMKAYPVTEQFLSENAPTIQYELYMENPGSRNLEIWTAPANPLHPGSQMAMELCINDGVPQVIHMIQEDYKAGEPTCDKWCSGVLEQRHRKVINIQVKKGKNRLSIRPMDPGLVLEKMIVYKENYKSCYLGPQ